jgi:hypothetical protein
MKFLALIEVTPGAGWEKIRAELVQELKGSWSLYEEGTLREAYATESPGRVVFVLKTPTRPNAEAQLPALPLIAAELLRYELIELRPFVNWSMLFSPPP